MLKQRLKLALTNLSGLVCMCYMWMWYNTYLWICNLQNFASLPLYLFHTRAFIQTACEFLSLYLLWESLPPPSGPLARRFFSFSSVRVMNHTCTHMQTHTFAFTHSHTNSPLLKTVNPSFYPHQVTTLAPRSPSFSTPFSLVTLSVLAPPSRHSKAKRKRLPK